MTRSLRPARTADVAVIRGLIANYTEDGRLLAKAPVTLYEDVQEFLVSEQDGAVVACGALHVIWADVAEVRTVAVDPAAARQGHGSDVLTALLDRARELGVARVFCLTFETEFFGRHGFVEIQGTPVSHDVYEQLLLSYDEGIAEFLDLERVKPNTLGNSRMLIELS